LFIQNAFQAAEKKFKDAGKDVKLERNPNCLIAVQGIDYYF
jgi:hypothetical protein